MGFVKEFKEFAMRGSVVDLAIGVVIGAAFGKIVTSMVDDLIMPIIGFITGGIDFSDLKYLLKAADPANEVAAVSINYGNFINTVVQFLIIAFVIFLVIKGINTLKRKQTIEEAAPVPATKEEILLTEIRDLLRNK
jgi:large conductance mechanosensitive channel